MKGIEDFILSVGKTRMRENLRHREIVLDNRAFSTSLFNLVAPEQLTDAEMKKDGFLTTTQNRLAKVLIEFAKPLTRRIAGLERMALLTRPQMGQGSMSASRLVQ